MASWFEKGRPALFEALTTVCQQIDNELRAELQQKDEEYALKAADTAQKGSKPSHDADFADDKDWKAEYAKLAAKYNALSNNFKKAREALQKRRDERDRWIEHAALLERRIKAVGSEKDIRVFDSSIKHSAASDHLETQAVRGVQDGSFTSEQGLDTTSAPENPAPLPTIASSPNDSGHPGPPSELASTQDDPEDQQEQNLPSLPRDQNLGEVKIKEEPSSEGAVFVLERSLKKRKYNDGYPETPSHRVVKAEPNTNSSSPQLSMHHCDFNPHESPDLGQVAQIIYTPRKRRELEATKELDQPYIDQQDSSSAEQNCSPSTEHARSEKPFVPQPRAFTSALTPIATNRQQPRQPATDLGNKPLRRGLGHGIARLAEDGGIYEKATPSSIADAPEVSPAVKGRLDALLNTPSVRDAPSTLKKIGRRSRELPTPSRDDLGIPKPRDLPFGENARQTPRGGNFHTPQASRTPLVDTTNTAHKTKGNVYSKKAGGLLRNKPLSELRLEDFKVNPKVNDGHDFAFSEVIRDKYERSCLPGCVDMHCCGKEMRAMALSHRPDPPLTAAQRQEEQKLLEDYLGEDAPRLKTITKQEREELWLEAKMRELANRFGRHRHRFSRMQSPPGFWDANFPSTQELEADRAEAAKREKKTIQERHREAMRPGGRWIFQDE